MQEPSFFLKGTAFEPPRQVILVYTPTEGDGPGCGPIGVSSQTWCVCFVGGCQALCCSFLFCFVLFLFFFFLKKNNTKNRSSVNMGKLVGSNSALAGAVKANELLRSRCLSLSHLWLDRWHILFCSPPCCSKRMDSRTGGRAVAWHSILP